MSYSGQKGQIVFTLFCVFTCVFVCFLFYKYALSPCLTPPPTTSLMHTQTHFNGRQKERAKRWTNTGEKTLGGIPWSELRCSVRTLTHTHTHTHTHTSICTHSNTQRYTHGHIHNGKWMSESCGAPISFRFTPVHGNTANQHQSIK